MSITTKVEITKRGVITLPARVRRELGLKEGDEILIEIKGIVKHQVIPLGEQNQEKDSKQLDYLVDQWVAFVEHVKKQELKETMRFIAVDPVAACAEALQITMAEAKQVLARVHEKEEEM